MRSYNEVKYSSLTSVYLTAKGFQNNYEDLKKRLTQTIGQVTYNNLMPVAATNGFFAAELYLKLIYAAIYWENQENIKDNPSNLTKFPTGHSLKKLFDDIDVESKRQIITLLPKIRNEKELLKILEKYKNGFMDWRYFFEKDYLEGDFVFLSSILDALYSLCKNYMEHRYRTKKEWQDQTPHTSTTMRQEKVQTENELRKLMNQRLDEGMCP